LEKVGNIHDIHKMPFQKHPLFYYLVCGSAGNGITSPWQSNSKTIIAARNALILKDGGSLEKTIPAEVEIENYPNDSDHAVEIESSSISEAEEEGESEAYANSLSVGKKAKLVSPVSSKKPVVDSKVIDGDDDFAVN